MSDRKNLKVSQETYEKLRDEKRKYETWDGFFHRLVNGDE